MDMETFISWTIVLVGVAVCIAGIAKGALAFFVKKQRGDGSYWDIDGGGVFIAALLLIVGIWIMGQGYDFPNDR